MDPVIIVGAGPVGLSLALALAAQDVPSVVLDEGAGHDEPRPARTVVLRPDTAAFVERLGCTLSAGDAARWVAWRVIRRSQQVRYAGFGNFSDINGFDGPPDGPDEPGVAAAGPESVRRCTCRSMR